MKSGIVIKKVQLTEKGTALSDSQNKYFFEVDRSANKHEVKRAVESLFDVTVKSVNTMNYAGKLRRERTIHYGRRPDWKRAIVTLKEGDNIDFT
jgi:large subunit ribosomal protein L23